MTPDNLDTLSDAELNDLESSIALARIIRAVRSMTREEVEAWRKERCTEYVSDFGTVTMLKHYPF